VNKNSKTTKGTISTAKKNSLKGTVSSAGLSGVPGELSGASNKIQGVSFLSTAEQKKIQDMLNIAQFEYQKIKTNVIKEKKAEIETLELLIKEFLGPYILIGYDLNSNPIEMVSAASTAEHDALLERLRRVVFKINQNIFNSGGNDPYGTNVN
jgi:hypothetical protein